VLVKAHSLLGWTAVASPSVDAEYGAYEKGRSVYGKEEEGAVESRASWEESVVPRGTTSYLL